MINTMSNYLNVNTRAYFSNNEGGQNSGQDYDHGYYNDSPGGNTGSSQQFGARLDLTA